jgi:hypothetical protein
MYSLQLYCLLPRAEEIGTDGAISDALSQREGTDYLGDISIGVGI